MTKNTVGEIDQSQTERTEKVPEQKKIQGQNPKNLRIRPAILIDIVYTKNHLELVANFLSYPL